MKYILTLLTIVMLLASAYASSAADLKINGQNQLRYARGEEPGQADGKSFSYFENYLNLNIEYDKYRIFLRHSFLLPSEFDKEQAGNDALDKRYIQYTDDNFQIRVGDFYRTMGRGLLFGNVELLELNFDSGLDGVVIDGEYKGLETTIFRGAEMDTASVFREAAEGIYLSYDLPWYDLRLGGIASHLDAGPRHPDLERWGAEFETTVGSVNWYTAYSADQLDREQDRRFNGFYSALSTFNFGMGLLVEYKNYRLFTYSDPALSGGATDSPSLQYPATAIPEITMYLLDRHPRIMHYADDVGYQIEWTTSYDEWNFLANYSRTSRHDGEKLMPSAKEEHSPYQSMLAQADYDPWEGNRIMAQGGWQEDIEFTHTATGGYSAWYRRTAGGGSYDYHLNDVVTMGLELEMMREEDKARDLRYWFEYYAFTYTQASIGTMTIGAEITDKQNETGGLGVPGGLLAGEGRYWPSVEFTMDIKTRHQARLFVGHERGGLRCSGGSCRQVNPFKGVKLTLTSQF